MKCGWARKKDSEFNLSKDKCYDLLKKAIITEKATGLSEFNKVVFEVSLTATKFEIKKAIEEVFGVKVVGVNTIRQLGKVKRFKGQLGKRIDRKKAVITLAEGHAIDATVGV